MDIELHCEKCGKLIKTSSKEAGKSGKCPYCDSDVYIPMPEQEIEELPLEPEDSAERQREVAWRRQPENGLPSLLRGMGKSVLLRSSVFAFLACVAQAALPYPDR